MVIDCLRLTEQADPLFQVQVLNLITEAMKSLLVTSRRPSTSDISSGSTFLSGPRSWCGGPPRCRTTFLAGRPSDE